jgi:hypothetical protein
VLKKSSTVFSSKLSLFFLILTVIASGVGAHATEVPNNKSRGYLLCVNTSTKVVTFPGKSVCPKGSKKLVLGAQGVAGTNGLPGAPGLPGKDGTNGKDGKTLWNGKVDPVSALGSPGDMFINTVTNTLFGPKSVESGWPVGVSLVGPKGERGPAGAAGPAGPAGAAGAAGAAGVAGAPAAPAFTLSSSFETRTVNTAASGFNVLSTGGPIASFSISATPPGMSFNTSTGVLSGTPTSISVPTPYTVSGRNATGSFTQTFTLTVTTNVVYAVGDTGPGGGRIFYVSTTPFACGFAMVSACTYLEAAPSDWYSGPSYDRYEIEAGYDPRSYWATNEDFGIRVNNDTSPETATAKAIGWGYFNTRAIIGQGNTYVAATLADSHTTTVAEVVFDDWYLPTKDELNQLYIQKDNIGGLANNWYWSSTEASLGDSEYFTADTYFKYAWQQYLETDDYTNVQLKASMGYVRPIRAF